VEVAAWLPQQILRQHSHRTEHHLRWLVDDLRVLLIGDMDGFPIDTAAYLPDVESEVEAAGYMQGGLPLLEPRVEYDQPTRQVRLHAAPTVWADSRIVAEGAVIWKHTDTLQPLLGVVDFDGPRMSVDGVFEIEWDPELGALAYEVVVPARFDVLVAA